MNEQIIITQDDNGIELAVSFIDKDKKAIDITNKSIEVVFVASNGFKDTRYARATDPINGKASYLLMGDLTNIVGLWNTYWSVLDDTSNVTAQDVLNYFVLAKYGGA